MKTRTKVRMGTGTRIGIRTNDCTKGLGFLVDSAGLAEFNLGRLVTALGAKLLYEVSPNMK